MQIITGYSKNFPWKLNGIKLPKQPHNHVLWLFTVFILNISSSIYQTSLIVHQLTPFFWLPSGNITLHGFLINSACRLSRKVWWAVQNGSFFPKLSYFTDQNGVKERSHGNEFWLFSNTKMNTTNNTIGKNRWKKWGHLSGFHVSFLNYGPWIVQKSTFFIILCWPQQEI